MSIRIPLRPAPDNLRTARSATLHPMVGELTLGFEAFTPMGDLDQTLGLYTIEAGSRSEHALRMLASWTADNARITSDKVARRED